MRRSSLKESSGRKLDRESLTRQAWGEVFPIKSASDSYSNHRLVWGLFGALAVVYAHAWYVSPVTYLSEDFTHFFNASRALQNPEQFLSTWDRPLFVMLYALPAQVGIEASRMFSVGTALLALYGTYKAAVASGVFLRPWMAIPLLGFLPYFFGQAYSTMTELLFACVLAWALYFYFAKSINLFAVMMGLLPLVRLEGVLYLAMGLIVLLLAFRSWGRKRQLISVAILLAPGLCWVGAGTLFYGDLLWFITYNAYRGTVTVVLGTNLVTGYFTKGLQGFLNNAGLRILLLLGCYYGVKRALQESNRGLWLIFAPLAISYVTIAPMQWVGPGKFFEAEPRYFVTIAPSIALILLVGIEGLVAFRGSRLLAVILSSLVGIFVLGTLFRRLAIIGEIGREGILLAAVGTVVVALIALLPHLKLASAKCAFAWCVTGVLALSPLVQPRYAYNLHKPNGIDRSMEEVAAWYKGSGLRERLIVTSYAGLPYLLEEDPKRIVFRMGKPYVKEAIAGAPPGSLFVWHASIYSPATLDSVPLEDLTTSRQFRELFRTGALRADISPDVAPTSRDALVVVFEKVERQ